MRKSFKLKTSKRRKTYKKKVRGGGIINISNMHSLTELQNIASYKFTIKKPNSNKIKTCDTMREFNRYVRLHKPFDENGHLKNGYKLTVTTQE